MKMNGTITVEVEIDDPQALHAKVGSDHCLVNPMDENAFDEAERMFGSAERPDVAACLAALFDVNHVEGGVRVVSCDASVSEGGRFETMRCVTVSMQHLTEAEVDRIVALFDPTTEDGIPRVKEEIRYAGVYFSSFHYGFIARMPSAEMLQEALDEMTPEMRGIFVKAVGQGARRISFDVDAEPVDGIPWFER